MNQRPENQEDVIKTVLTNLHKQQGGMTIDKPSKKQAMDFVMDCFKLLFPINARKTRCYTEDEALLYNINNQLTNMLLPVRNELEKSISEICTDFLMELPTIHRKLMKDAKAICDFDPASSDIDEVILTYPGFFAITTYRLAHVLRDLHVPMIPRLMSEYAHSLTGIDINPGAEIGESFFIDHGTGIVIGETCVIANNVKIYQGVTLGALQVKKELASTKRHPTVEDNVIIYSNATILGGETVIGKGSIIGGNVWITASVPENSLVYHTKQIKLKTILKYIKVSCGILRKDDKFFMAQRSASDKSEPNKWEFPGGKLEIDETPSEAIIRELKEELTIDVKPVKEFPMVEFENEKYNIEFYPFEVELTRGNINLLEHQNSGWFTIDEVKNLDLSSGDRKIVEELF